VSEEAAIRVYARSLFDVATSHDEVEVVDQELKAFLEALQEHRNLRDALFNPRVEVESKRGVLEAVVEEANPHVLNFLRVLIDQGRMPYLGRILEAYDALLDEARHRVHVGVTSAMPLTEQERERIRQAVEQKTSSSAVMHENVDTALLGGLIIRVGGKVLDGSAATRLRSLRQRLESMKIRHRLWESSLGEMEEDLRERLALGPAGAQG
jgi:F-type H+-transporting ATPase subunit delta